MSLADKIRRGAPLPLPARLLLNAATPLTRGAMALRLRGHRSRVDARVISFGNLTAGGTGKTPAVVERARIELSAGHRVAVLTRGHGSRRTHEPLLVREAIPFARAVGMIGDEPALIRALLPEVAVVKSADRVKGAQAAIDAGYDVIIMDDGYQAVSLERDENVLLVDAVNPFGNGKLLPRGILREPLHAAVRATHLCITHCDLVPDERIQEIGRQLRFFCPAAPLRHTWHAPARLRKLHNSEECSLDALMGEKVIAVCAIGHPETFVATLQSLGARVVEQRFFRDHARIPGEAFAGPGMVVTTEKDAVRTAEAAQQAWALGIELRDWPPTPGISAPSALPPPR